MTNPKKSKDASKAVTVPAGSQTTPLPDFAALNLPRVAAPYTSQSHQVYCVGEPDIFRIRLLNMAGILLCLAGMVFIISVMIVIYPGIETPASALFSTIALFAAGIVAFFVGLFTCARNYNRAGGWFIVDEIGFRYGLGAKKEGDPVVEEARVAWHEIVRAPNDYRDVTSGLVPGYYSGKNNPAQPALRFWQHTPLGGTVLRHLLFQGCVPHEHRSLCRFRNSRDLLKAILYGFAVHCDGLRFDPNVFVRAAIDPRTWLPMPRPLLETKTAIVARGAIPSLWICGGMGLALVFLDTASNFFMFLFLLLTLVLIVSAIPVGSKFNRWSNAQWKQRHPDLIDTIIFTREAKDRREGKTSEGEL